MRIEEFLAYGDLRDAAIADFRQLLENAVEQAVQLARLAAIAQTTPTAFSVMLQRKTSRQSRDPLKMNENTKALIDAAVAADVRPTLRMLVQKLGLSSTSQASELPAYRQYRDKYVKQPKRPKILRPGSTEDLQDKVDTTGRVHHSSARGAGVLASKIEQEKSPAGD